MVVNEVKALYTLRESPHIITLFDVFEDNKKIYLIFEYCSKGDLFDYVKHKGIIIESTPFYDYK